MLVHSLTQVGLQSKGYAINNAEAINLRLVIASAASPVSLNATEPVIPSPTTSDVVSTTTVDVQRTVTVVFDTPTVTPRVQKTKADNEDDDDDDDEREREREEERREEAAERRLGALRGETVNRRKMARHRRQVAHVKRQEEVVTEKSDVTGECATSIKWAAELVTRSTRQDIAVHALSSLTACCLLMTCTVHRIFALARSTGRRRSRMAKRPSPSCSVRRDKATRAYAACLRRTAHSRAFWPALSLSSRSSRPSCFDNASVPTLPDRATRRHRSSLSIGPTDYDLKLLAPLCNGPLSSPSSY